MRLIADNKEEYQQLSLLQKMMTKQFKKEKEVDNESTLTMTLKKFIGTSIEKTYMRPGQSAKIANEENVMDTDDKSLFIAYIVMAAIQRKKLAVQYRDGKGNESQRVIEPHNWRNNQVVAWCHERGAWRQFKPSMMERVAVTNESFDRQEDITIVATDATVMAHLIN